MAAVHHKPSVRRCITYTKCALSPECVRHVGAAKTQPSLRNAQEYFEEHLCVGDYWIEGERVSGEWFGLGAQRLSLSRRVRADADATWYLFVVWQRGKI